MNHIRIFIFVGTLLLLGGCFVTNPGPGHSSGALWLHDLPQNSVPASHRVPPPLVSGFSEGWSQRGEHTQSQKNAEKIFWG